MRELGEPGVKDGGIGRGVWENVEWPDRLLFLSEQWSMQNNSRIMGVLPQPAPLP
jgi:hypothetical protein